MTSVSFVVPTFRRPRVLRETLGALCAVDYPSGRCEIIVVDDGPDTDTEEAVGEFRSAAIEITYIAQGNQGAAAARNHGVRHATGEFVILCDDDTIVERTHIRHHLATHEAYGDCLVNGRRDFSPATLAALRATPFGRFRISLEERFMSLPSDRPIGGSCVETGTMNACNLSIRRDAFEALAGFDEAFPWAGAEDQEFSLRAREAGHRLIRNDAIRLLHNDSTVTLEQFCRREERGAETVVLLARKHRDAFADLEYIVENRPVSREDPPRLKLKKGVKLVLSRHAALSVEHRAIGVLERWRVAEPYLGRLYSALIGLHMFRGVRRRLNRLDSRKTRRRRANLLSYF